MCGTPLVLGLTGKLSVPRKCLQTCGSPRRLAGRPSVTLALALLAVWPAGTARAAASTTAPSAAQRDAAARFAGARAGAVSYAVIDGAGRLHSRGGTRAYATASLGKTLLLAAALRRHPHGPLPPALTQQLDPMIRTSDNDAAHVVLRALGGDADLRAAADAAGMRHTTFDGTWSNITVTAPDVARLFHRLDRVVPHRHRAYAHRLLGTVTPRQRWGIPHALAPKGWRVEFKGGWRGTLVTQGAVARRPGRRVALAILTDGGRSHEYGRATLEGVARRLLTTSR